MVQVAGETHHQLGCTAIVIHSAMGTGATRIGLEVAAFLKGRGADVILLSPEHGPLVSEAQRRQINVRVDTELDYSEPDSVIEVCTSILQQVNAKLVFCNSLATSCWAIAGRRLEIKTVLHALEMKGEMQSLLGRGLLFKDIGICADALVVAASRVTDDFSKVVGAVPPQIFRLGSFIDVPDVLARRDRFTDVNWQSSRQPSGTRPIVGMCGLGGVRKGFDRFVAIAKKLPQYDFVWAGDTSDEHLLKGVLAEGRSLENMFVSGWIENPIPVMSKFSVFLLTSREDPNPLAALEAYALGVPLIVFTGTGETWECVREGCYTHFGDYDEDQAINALQLVIDAGPRPPHELPGELRREKVLEGLAIFLESLVAT